MRIRQWRGGQHRHTTLGFLKTTLILWTQILCQKFSFSCERGACRWNLVAESVLRRQNAMITPSQHLFLEREGRRLHNIAYDPPLHTMDRQVQRRGNMVLAKGGNSSFVKHLQVAEGLGFERCLKSKFCLHFPEATSRGGRYADTAALVAISESWMTDGDKSPLHERR